MRCLQTFSICEIVKLCEIVYVVNYVKLQESNHIVATYSAYVVSIPRRLLLLLIITNNTAKDTRVVFSYCMYVRTYTHAQYTEVRADLIQYVL